MCVVKEKQVLVELPVSILLSVFLSGQVTPAKPMILINSRRQNLISGIGKLLFSSAKAFDNLPGLKTTSVIVCFTSHTLKRITRFNCLSLTRWQLYI